MQYENSIIDLQLEEIEAMSVSEIIAELRDIFGQGYIAGKKDVDALLEKIESGIHGLTHELRCELLHERLTEPDRVDLLIDQIAVRESIPCCCSICVY